MATVLRASPVAGTRREYHKVAGQLARIAELPLAVVRLALTQRGFAAAGSMSTPCTLHRLRSGNEALERAKRRSVPDSLAIDATTHADRDQAIEAACASGGFTTPAIGDYDALHHSRINGIIRAVPERWENAEAQVKNLCFSLPHHAAAMEFACNLSGLPRVFSDLGLSATMIMRGPAATSQEPPRFVLTGDGPIPDLPIQFVTMGLECLSVSRITKRWGESSEKTSFFGA